MNTTTNRTAIALEDLERVNGGSYIESCGLAVALSKFGYDDLFKYDGNETIDYDALKKFFASKGYTFIPSEDDPNLFLDKSGKLHSYMGILEKIMTETL